MAVVAPFFVILHVLMGAFRILCFGSGSSGNCFYFQNDEGAFLIDAGVGISKMRKYFAMYDIVPQSISGVFLTHDHIDHVRCACSFAKRAGIPIYATESVWQGMDISQVIRTKIPIEYRRIIQKNMPMDFLGCRLTAFDVPHDSSDNVGYYICYKNIRLVHVTDDGSMTDEIQSYIAQANCLTIESNYDEDMLRNGAYPTYLKTRIFGTNGHLSNREAAETIYRHYKHLSHVWLCHISANNNTPQKALDEVVGLLRKKGVAEQDFPVLTPLNRTEPTGFFDL